MVKRKHWMLILPLLAVTVIVGCGQSGDDLIVLQNGSQQTGTLQGCVNSSCQLNSQAIPRAAIAWIGLSYAGSNPPPITNPASDEIHARDGSIDSAHLIGISDSKVVTDRQSYERTQVAWIHLGLASAPDGGANQPDSETPTPGTTLIHYDVKVTGHQQSATTNFGYTAPIANGTLTTTVDWTTTFRNVVLRKELGEPGTDGFVIASGVPDAEDIEGGTTDVKYTFEETIQQEGGPCHGTIQLPQLGSYLLLVGSRNVRSYNDFSFHTGLDRSAQDQLEAAIKTQTVAACRGHEKSFPTWDNNLTLADLRGLTIRRKWGEIYLIAERQDPRGGPLLSPLKELATGDAFSFTTGEVRRSFSGGGEHTTITAITGATVDVGRSRNRQPPPLVSSHDCASTSEADSRLQANRKSPDLQYKAWAACVERARCKKTPESACDDRKPPGHWPDVP